MKKIFLSILIVTNVFVLSAFSQTEITLTIRATGFKSNIGQSILELYRKEDNVPKKPFMVLKANIVNNEATFSVKNLAYGDYAAIIVHDQNSNGKIDHSFGIPSEPLGFTNNWELGLFSGMPSFEKLKFTFSKTNISLTVKMND
jgi:uncharacterized protein (DUF2141 family)